MVNITYNPMGWKNTYINPKAGHSYARKNPGGECLNFCFNKKGIDTKEFFFGFVQWKSRPIRFENGGIIIFYTHNTTLRKGEIVGVYGNAEILKENKIFSFKGFNDDYYPVNIKAEKALSILFPLPLEANRYKKISSERLVGQNGFIYKDTTFAEQILNDEIIELLRTGLLESEYKKLVSIYNHYAKSAFAIPFLDENLKEQLELESLFTKSKSKPEIIEDLKNLKESDNEEIIVNHKTYKRDNKTIAQLKILRDFKCQLCNEFILKKDGSRYIEAAHIIPKHKKGRETPDNILILCPNHHKEFDFGKRVIISKSLDEVVFTINEMRYCVKLSLE